MPRSRAAPWMLAMATIAVLRSTSSSAHLSLIIFLVGFALFNFFRFPRPEAERRSITVTVAGALLLWRAAVGATASDQMVEPGTAFFDEILSDKIESDSGVERMRWNTRALTNFCETWGLGARHASIRAARAGVFAMLASAVLTHATPDLGLFVFALAGAATGLSRAAAMESLGPA